VSWQYTPYLIPLFISAVAPLALLPVTVRNRDVDGATPLIGVLVAATAWSGAITVQVAAVELETKLLLSKVPIITAGLISISVLFMALEYTHLKQWATLRNAVILGCINLVSTLLVLTNEYHHLTYQEVGRSMAEGIYVLDSTFGPAFWVHTAYNYTLILIAVVLFAREFLRQLSVKQYRGQAGAVLLATLVPWLLNMVSISGLVPIDLTAIGFTVMGVMVAAALFRYQLLSLVPVARGTAVKTMNAGYFVISPDNEIVDINEEGARMVQRPREELIGTAAEDAFGGYGTVVEQFRDVREAAEQVAVEVEGELCHVDINISPIYDSSQRYTGRVVLVYDVTEQVRRQRELEAQKEELARQNERLEAFAETVSHDLRNPLNVARGHLDLARDSPDEAHFDEIETALGRMDELIDDILTLARQGQSVSETEPLEVETIAALSWDTVETNSATLEREADVTVEADRKRLRQLFENLFRNAVEHGPEGVSVTVGALEDGFYVADDGPGIPADERDSIFEQGYTTSEDGSGFGLAIVESGVEAHGWSIDVTASDRGGARFEIAGCDSTHPPRLAGE